jgi:TonB family protein
MQRLEIHGTVSVRVSIDTSGTITSASVVSGSGHPSYDSQAAQWVRSRWRYKWVGGTPEGGVTRTVQVRF